jgi:O-succinylbenzoic acid--CoA ligase
MRQKKEAQRKNMPIFPFLAPDFPLEDAPALYILDEHLQARVVSYHSYALQAEIAARRFAECAAREGALEARCAFVARNTPETAALLLGALRAGIVAMPLSPYFPERLRAELVRAAVAGIYDADKDKTALHNRTGFLAQNFDIQNFDIQNFDIRPENNATIICSSGSSGLPKMFVHTVQNHLSSALGAAENMPFGRGDVWLASLPLYHVGGYAIFFRALASGGAIAFPRSASFTPEVFAETLERLPVTHCSLVATQLYRALRYEPALRQLRGLKAILLGGGAIPESLARRALEEGLRIYASYGCTEMASQITATKEPTWEELQTSGRALPRRELRISPKGEILVRGETLARGRLAENGALRAITDEEGWYHTGDAGELDAKGRLLVHGRLDAMFISGGENIYPEVVERALCRRDDVAQAIVVPAPDEEFGFRPVAFVERKNGRPPDDAAWTAELLAFLREELPRFACPDAFYAFPEENGGVKPRRNELRQYAARLRARK